MPASHGKVKIAPKSCKLTVVSPAGERHLPLEAGESILDALARSGIALPTHCGGSGACGLCRIQLEGDSASPMTQTEYRHIDPAQLQQGQRLACQVRPRQDVRIGLMAIGKSPRWQPMEKQALPPAQDRTTAAHRSTGQRYGIAVDFGTTRIRLSLWDRHRRVRLGAVNGLNPQMRFGSDILQRLTAAVQSPDASRQISRISGRALATGISDLASRHGLDADQIAQVTVVANTAMLALLTGKGGDKLLLPEYWKQPIACLPDDISALKKLWEIEPETTFDLIPALGGFVGSDLLAAVLAAGLDRSVENKLLIDFGTNSEIALWDGQRLWVTSAAGGPAFDGCGIRCGMPAEPGAIYRIGQNSARSGYRYKVLGDSSPKGLCGSGVIDAIALLRATGRLAVSGKFNACCRQEDLCIAQGVPEITIAKEDVDVFQRAKAAIGAGIVSLLDEAGISFEDLRRVFVCGAFGRHIHIENAKVLGLLPDIPASRFEIFANAALVGSERLLLSENGQKELSPIRLRSHLIGLVESDSFETHFINHLYLQPMQQKTIERHGRDRTGPEKAEVPGV